MSRYLNYFKSLKIALYPKIMTTLSNCNSSLTESQTNASVTSIGTHDIVVTVTDSFGYFGM